MGFPVRYISAFAYGIALLALPACSGAPPQPASAWLSDRGGLLFDGPDAARLSRIVAHLLTANARPTIQVRLLATTDPGAFAWPDHRIYVSRGLLQLLDDTELAAAIAHELGHLTDAPAARSILAVDGTGDPGDEARADRIGLAILRRSGIDPAAMPRMLAKLQAHPQMSAETRQTMGLRIALLQAASDLPRR